MSKLTETFKKLLTCPYCEKQISVVIDHDINIGTNLASEQYRAAAEQATVGGAKLDDYSQSLDAQQRQVLASIESAGFIAPFAAAFEASHGTRPKVIAKTILPWLKMAKQKLIAREVLRVFAEEFGGSISFIAHQSVGAVVSNGEIVQFLPCIVVGDAPAGSFGISRTGDQLANEATAWIRTKYGYVAKSGAALDAMRKRSYGEFCNPIQ